ncbi:MAG: hypothetical protein Q4G04_06330 [bacterium]|nr:hypothetical protein [bacterium]
MVLSTIILIISFFIDNISSNLIAYTLTNSSILMTIYTVVALVVIYPYFDNDKKYLILTLAFGLLFDIASSNTFLLNTTIFFLIALIIKFIYMFLSDNVLTTIIISVIAIVLYYLLSYFIVIIVNYGDYPIFLLWEAIYKSLIMTIIYSVILYFIAQILYNKFNIKFIK